MFRNYLFFISGQFGLFMMVRYFYQFFPKYTSEKMGDVSLVAAGWIGFVLLIFRIFDGVSDPIAGGVSDQWVRRGKKRQHLLWFSFLLVPVGLYLCFFGTHEMADGLKKGVMMVGLFIFYVGYTFYAIPYWSLVDDYSEGNENRRRILSNLLGGGMMLATAVMFVAVPFLTEAVGYTKGALIVGGSCAVLLLLPTFAAPKRGHVSNVKNGEFIPFWRGMKLALSHRRFVALICLFSGSQMSFTILTSAALFITEDLLHGTQSDVGKVFGPLIGLAIPSFLMVPFISRKLGWEKGMLLGSIGAGIVYSLSGALGTSVIGSPMLTAGLLFAIGGPMVAVLLGLEGEAVVDCAVERGGNQLIGVYWGVFNFIVKILNGLAMVILFYWIDRRDEIGSLAVRWMSFSAGGLLLIGVVAYLLVRKKGGSSKKQR